MGRVWGIGVVLFFTAQAFAAPLALPPLQWKALARGVFQPEFPGARVLLTSGRPALPYLERRVDVPSGWSVEASLEGQVWEALPVRPLFVVPGPLSWSGWDLTQEPPRGEFPGRVLVAEAQGDGLNLQIFPLQHDAATGRLRELRAAELVLHFTREAPPVNVAEPFARESVIVAPRALRAAAEKLAAFQDVPTDVVSVEDLDVALPESEYPEGAKDPAFRARELKDYDFETARKIAGYLRGRMQDGRTKYVTLLGDLPASYYFAAREVGVTDACYFASDGCLKPRLALGRLPFRTEGEVDRWIAKARRFRDEAGKAESEAAFLGGRAFPGEVFLGQLGVLAALDRAEAGWRGARKLFLSRGVYKKEPVLDVLSSKTPSVVVYHLDHGKGNRFGLDDAFLTSDEIAAARGGAAFSPFVVSIACTNAAFDEGTPKKNPFEFPASGKQSVGVTLLKQDGGAIGYLGSFRPSVGSPVFQVDKHGNADVLGSTHAVQLLGGFVEGYALARGGRAGDLWLAEQKRYVARNDMKDRWHRWTFWNAGYLGDPLLRLPHRREPLAQNALARSTTVFDAPKTFVLPRFWTNLVMPKVGFEGRGKLLARLLKIDEDIESLSVREFRDRGALDVPAQSAGRFLLELENGEGAAVERQVWLEVEKRD